MIQDQFLDRRHLYVDYTVIVFLLSINSLRPCDSYVWQYTKPIMLQTMDFRLISLLSIGSLEQTSVKFELKYNTKVTELHFDMSRAKLRPSFFRPLKIHIYCVMVWNNLYINMSDNEILRVEHIILVLYTRCISRLNNMRYRTQHDREIQRVHDDVIKWKHFPRYWPYVRGIQRWPVNSPHKGQWRLALMLSLICAWINGWVNNLEAGDLRRNRTHYDVIVMALQHDLDPCIVYCIGNPRLFVDIKRILIAIWLN